MAKFYEQITVADETALKAIASPPDGDLRLVENPTSLVSLPPAWYRLDSAAAFTELKPAIINPTTGTGQWIMCGVGIIISANDASGTPPFAGMIWQKTGSNLSWRSQNTGSGNVWIATIDDI